METTISETTQQYIETTADNPLATAVTDITNGIEIFFYDVSEYNNNSATFWDSVSRFANNIIHSVASCKQYFVWVHDIANSAYNSDYMPSVIGTMCSIALFFLLLNFIRNR